MGDQFLAVLDDRVHELFDSTAFDAYHMIVVSAFVELEDSLIAFEVMALNEARRLELCQHTVDGGESDIFPRLQEAAIDILGGHMLVSISVQDLKYLGPR